MSKVVANSARVLQVATAASLDDINALCDRMADLARELTPYDTGNNKDNIETDTSMKDGKPVGRVYTQSGYGGWLEIGTSRMAARPYLAPAYQRAKDWKR